MSLNRTPKVVLTTFGTHGDLHPMLAVAIELKQRGIAVRLAAAPIYRAKVEGEGIDFAPMRPDVEDVAEHLGLSERDMVRRVAARPDFLIRNVILPHLRESYEDAMVATEDADLVVTQSASYGARIAADQRGLPHIAVVLQPLGLMSIHDPPLVSNLPQFSAWIYRRGERWTRAYIGAGRLLSRRWARPIERLRSELGLPASAGHPLFEGQLCGDRVIALFSPLIASPQPDHPPRTSIVGFAFHDAASGVDAALAPDLERFLAAGEPPIVFTQGTSAVHDADDFVRESLAALELLRIRAVFVLDAERGERWKHRATDTVCVTGYAPYSQLFPRAAITVHHGGIGTTAQALRAGRPQLIAPYLVDQPDNAARMARLGVSRVLPLKDYRASAIANELRTLLTTQSYAHRAREVGRMIAAENGAAAAADLVIETLRDRKRF